VEQPRLWEGYLKYDNEILEFIEVANKLLIKEVTLELPGVT
jgi:hypothetical protein